MNGKLVNVLTVVFGLRKEQIVPALTKEMVGKWDSLAQMDLVAALEHEFSVTLEIADIKKINSVASIIEALRSKGVDLGD
jgi:acyl carrier protein